MRGGRAASSELPPKYRFLGRLSRNALTKEGKSILKAKIPNASLGRSCDSWGSEDQSGSINYVGKACLTVGAENGNRDIGDLPIWGSTSS